MSTSSAVPGRSQLVDTYLPAAFQTVNPTWCRLQRKPVLWLRRPGCRRCSAARTRRRRRAAQSRAHDSAARVPLPGGRFRARFAEHFGVRCPARQRTPPQQGAHSSVAPRTARISLALKFSDARGYCQCALSPVVIRPRSYAARPGSCHPVASGRQPPWARLLTVQIEVWSDTVCPWCYIGLKRLQQAL